MEIKRESQPGQLGWGIVGTGVIARQFAADISHCKSAALTAICSRSQNNAQTIARVHNIDGCYTSLQDMLNDKNVDAVYVATPNHTHISIAKEVITAGKAAMIEKPIASTVAEAEALAQLAAKKNVFLMEAMWSRFLPAWQHAKHLIDNGELGQIEKISADLAFNHPHEEGSRFYDLEQGGGALRDLGVYPISLTLFLFGKPVSINGTWCRGMGGVDVSAGWSMRFKNFSARFSCAINREGGNSFLIKGDAGALVVGSPFIGAKGIFCLSRRLIPLAHFLASGGGLSKVARAVLKRVPIPGVIYTSFEYSGSGLQFETDAASLAIRAGKICEPTSPVQDCCEVLSIVQKILESEPVAGEPRG